jgi:hypothetical protein
MKTATCLALASLFLAAGCSTMGRPYIGGNDCDEIVDARARLDCLERADRAESEWREELRREQEEKDKEETGKD